jgi:sugar O-acyltransferase (sialic acid O-acetyltransferase NeuD family)
MNSVADFTGPRPRPSPGSPRLVVIGSSGHARVVIDIVRSRGSFEVAGLLDPARPVGEYLDGVAVLGREDQLPALREQYQLQGFVVAIGDNHVRGQVFERLRDLCPALETPVLAHASAVISPQSSLGPGCVIAASAIVGPGAQVGRCCIVNTAASLDHDALLGDFASLAPGAMTGGAASVGRYTAIGMGAMVVHGVCVGEQTVVGAASLVARDLGSQVVAYGVPARVVRSRSPGDRYL